MINSSIEWWLAVKDAAAVGEKLCNTTEEFDEACEHIVQLLEDASTLLAMGSHATALFLSITALEETSKVHVGTFRSGVNPVKRSKDPLYKHGTKHRLALGPTVAMGSRLQVAIGEARMNELIDLAKRGEMIALRETALYVEQQKGALCSPKNSISTSLAREILLLAIEAFGDSLVGFTSRSFELDKQTDRIFDRWA